MVHRWRGSGSCYRHPYGSGAACGNEGHLITAVLYNQGNFPDVFPLTFYDNFAGSFLHRLFLHACVDRFLFEGGVVSKMEWKHSQNVQYAW
jgi:hypothetical protein